MPLVQYQFPISQQPGAELISRGFGLSYPIDWKELTKNGAFLPVIWFFHGGNQAPMAFITTGDEGTSGFNVPNWWNGDWNGFDHNPAIPPIPGYVPVVGAPLGGTAAVYLGSSLGLDATFAWSGTGTGPFGYGAALAAGDVDGDGFDDLLVGGASGNPSLLLYYGAAGGPDPAPGWSAVGLGYVGGVGTGSLGSEVAFADLDGDGFEDIVARAADNAHQARVFAWLGSAAGPVTAAVATDVGSFDQHFGEAISSGGDIDGDGDDDLLVGEPFTLTGGTVWVYPGGSFDTTDSDSDGLADVSDRCPGSPDAFDADLDSVPDGCDVCAGDDTLDADLDGVPDSCDTCAGFDDVLDADLDAVPDACDDCPTDSDFSQRDADSDGLGDACDACPGADDGRDADGDGAPDGCDACPGNDDGIDGDLDHVPDGCDDCPTVAQESQLDTDDDGVGDVCDVCPSGDDALDADLDGVPDGCDACPGESDAVDADLDLVADGCDDCPAVRNPFQVDSDHDGAGDACDRCPDSDDQMDANGNGIPDGCDLAPDTGSTAEPPASAGAGGCGCASAARRVALSDG